MAATAADAAHCQRTLEEHEFNACTGVYVHEAWDSADQLVRGSMEQCCLLMNHPNIILPQAFRDSNVSIIPDFEKTEVRLVIEMVSHTSYVVCVSQGICSEHRFIIYLEVFPQQLRTTWDGATPNIVGA